MTISLTEKTIITICISVLLLAFTMNYCSHKESIAVIELKKEQIKGE